MSVDKATVKRQLRAGSEDEFEYRDANCDIGGYRARESTVHIDHFVVKRDKRGENIATTLITALYEVLRAMGIYTLTIKMGATECSSREELAEQRADNGDDWQDPTYHFLNAEQFRDLEYVDTWQWGLCVKGHRRL